MRFQSLLAAAALGIAPLALAEVTSFSPDTRNDVFFSVAVPDSTASSGSGPILLQIKAPSTVEWVGLAQGTSMAGANMFVLYKSASQNVTLSPRAGEGHIPPQFNPDAQVTLLEGTGIENGVMTANVRCDSCINWSGGSLDPTSAESSWIYAYKNGEPLNSNSVAESIAFHDGYGGANIDLSRARTNSDNPFLNYDPASSSNQGSSTGGGGGGGHGLAMLVAHGLLMSFAFVLLFPVFAILVPMPIPISVMKVHAPLQIFTLAVAIAGMGLGLRIAYLGDLWKNAHPIIGLIVMGSLILFQPALGSLQHRHFRRTGGKSVFAYGHRWLGRGMIVLGIINGGLGFDLKGVGTPGAPRGAMIAYSVIAGVIGLAYVMVHLLVAVQGRRRGVDRHEEPKDGSRGDSQVEQVEG